MPSQLPSQYIICRDKLPTQVTVTHGSLDAAKAEAERLARKQNDRFMVFELIGIVAPAQPPLAWTWRREATASERFDDARAAAQGGWTIGGWRHGGLNGIDLGNNQTSDGARAAAQRDLLYPDDLGSHDLGDDWMGDIDPTDGEPFGAK